MAITQGQGNPDWTEEETILAVDLYIANDRKTISKDDPRVLKLSELLQGIPWPKNTTRNEKFRNNQGVSMKVLNLRAVELGVDCGIQQWIGRFSKSLGTSPMR